MDQIKANALLLMSIGSMSLDHCSYKSILVDTLRDLLFTTHEFSASTSTKTRKCTHTNSTVINL